MSQDYATEYDPKLGNPVALKQQACPREDLHTPSPRGYLEWHEWAERKAKTHVQRRCPGCTLFSIWVPRP
jgi:hypothetical protein